MDELRKISSRQLYTFWRNLSLGLLIIAGMTAISTIVPFYVSPIIALMAALVIYTLLYNNKVRQKYVCMVVFYSLLASLLVYCGVTIVLNLMYIFEIVDIPHEFLFVTDPYIPSLILCPVCFVTIGVMYLRRARLRICLDCRLQNGSARERGSSGNILTHESHYQMRNLIGLFGVLSVITWVYYLLAYVNTNVNSRDWYVFVWLVVIAFVLDEIYFITRYYNLYLDLKENDEIITEEYLIDVTAKTYIRYYVICGDYIYVHATNEFTKDFDQLDTPFYVSRNQAGISLNDIDVFIKNMTGVSGGELRFFYGRKLPELTNHTLLRYFYFLEGDIDDYPELNRKGEWYSFEKLKGIYNQHPNLLTPLFSSDITRIATIILTQKVFNEMGYRRNKLRSYQPSFTLNEVRHGNYDFQDDKWIRVSLFNADSMTFRIRHWFKRLLGIEKRKSVKEL